MACHDTHAGIGGRDDQGAANEHTSVGRYIPVLSNLGAIDANQYGCWPVWPARNLDEGCGEWGPIRPRKYPRVRDIRDSSL
jgi:hypothetical protein